jgi:hypothetical protein
MSLLMNSQIIGRHEEQQELNDIFNSKKSEFVAVFGRRRVGKTYLIKNFFQTKDCLYFQVIGLQHGALEVQLENFTEALSEVFYDNMPLQRPANWKEALQRLTTAINKYPHKKMVLFFDELPWMATSRSGLLEALDYIWNKHWVNNPQLKLIICGSSASWIIKKIIYNKGGLHNRVTRQMIIRPFLLNETKSYLESLGCKLNPDHILEIYMAIGGIPYYLNGIKKNLSANQNINNLCFRREGLLFDEFNKLFKSLFYDANAYIELIRIIAQKRYGISRAELEEQAKLSQKGGTLTDRLKDLEETGFILSFLPMEHKTRGVYYKVIDEFCLFYLTWLEPEKDTLIKMEAKSNFWKLKHNTPAWNSWSGYAFEAICYKHLSQIRQALDIPENSSAFGWRYVPTKGEAEQGAQIDLLFDRDDNAITICEIKFCDEPYTITKSYAKNLLNKKNLFAKKTKTQKLLFLAIIAAHGVKENFYTDELISKTVSLEDLFR